MAEDKNGVKNMLEDYAKAEDFPEMLGKRAQIKTIERYTHNLHGKTGIISEVYGCLFMIFDIPASLGTAWEMKGVYLTTDAFEIIE